ncbi:MAG: amino acid adenylation domain-containing protein [Acidobacteriota bacterium]|nr:amino acid adenylation domain-containing protein [Acidobacteriota bacterium]
MSLTLTQYSESTSVNGEIFDPPVDEPSGGDVFVFPTSFAQQRLWFLNQLEPGSSAYNLPIVMRVSGALNVATLEQSLDKILRRHEALRTTFAVLDGQLVQVIDPNSSLHLRLVDLCDLCQVARESEARRLVSEAIRRPFDLSVGPLFRAALWRLGAKDHLLLLNMHHAVADGWSFDVLLKELKSLYQSSSTGQRDTLPELPIQYADFAQWQNEWLQGEVLEAQLAYWGQQLSDLTPELNLPADRPRPAVLSSEGAVLSVPLPKPLIEKLKVLSRREGVTLFMTMLAAFKALLYRYTGQTDISVGSPVANRNRVEIENLIGVFVNTLVLRTSVSGELSFRSLLERVREVSLGAYAHQDLPFEKLVEELRPLRDRSRSPLFQVMFTCQKAFIRPLKLPGVTFTPVRVDRGGAPSDLTLFIIEGAEGLTASFEYNTDLFDEPTINRMLGHYETLLEGIVGNAEQRVGELPLLTAEERHQLLVEWNQTQTTYPRDLCVHQLFEEQAASEPAAVALVCGQERMTYDELNRRANRLAHHLRKRGVGPGALVGVCLPRSAEMVVALLGVLKAGGAYVPLDAGYPRERLRWMMEDARVAALVTERQLRSQLPTEGIEVVCVDADEEAIARESAENLTSGATAEDLAYVIYTSGSTGKPKGVAVTHRNIVRLVKQTNYVELTSREVFLQFAPATFDASTFELWGCLLNGARLVVFPAHSSSLKELSQVLKEQQVTTLWLTAGLFHQMVDDHLEGLKGVRQLLAGGDVLSVPHVEKVLSELKDCQLINGYGPTENTTFTCCHRVTASAPLNSSVPIGRPVSNTQVYVLDRYLQPVPVGVAGELYVGGDGLARGYLNRPELTAERFVPHPFSDEANARLYKTGDLVRYLPDGALEYLGRLDHQVKIRGFRIEPDEIKTVLAQHPAVRECVVVAREDTPGDKRLAAYVVPIQKPTHLVNELQHFLKQRVPDYMLPSAFVMLDALPLTLNGKVDRQALPAPDRARFDSEREFVAPRNALEQQLAQIWEEVLGVQPVGIKDNFFELGGHSLLVVRMMDRIEQEGGKKLPLATLFAEATVEHLAGVFSQRVAEDASPSLVQVQLGNSQRPFFFLHGDYTGGGFYCLNLARHLGADQPFYVLQPHGIDGQPIPSTIEAMATDHLKTLRTFQPEGPYLLGGYCNGGLVAFEMARQLVAQGQKVEQLVLLDASAYNNRYRLLYKTISGCAFLFGIDFEKRLAWFTRARDFANCMRGLSLSAQLIFVLRKSRKKIKIVAELFKAQKRGSRARAASLAQGSASRMSEDASRSNEGMYDKYEAYVKASVIYFPQAYAGPLTLLLPCDSEVNSADDPTAGWGRVASEMVVHSIPGDHVTCVTRHVKVLAEHLNSCLRSTVK